MHKQSDLTTGGIIQKLVFVALPIMGTQLMQMLYNLTDMAWLGRLSPEAVAATGAAGMFMWLSMALLFFGRMGAEIGVAQNKGRGDMEKANAFARNAWLLGLALGLVYGSTLVIFCEQLVTVFNIQEPGVRRMAADYLRIIGFGVPATYMSAAFTGAFNGSGNSRIPFYANATGLFISVALDPLLIFTLGLGVRGAAIATALANWIVFGLLLLAVKKHKDRPFERIRYIAAPDRKVQREIVRWALPIFLESALFSILTMAVTRLVAGFGSDALAVSRVATQIESLGWLIGGGFGSALTAFMGQNYGAGKPERIARGFRLASVTMAIWGAVVASLLFFGGYALFGLFLPDHGLQAMGADYLRILAACQIASCMEAVGGGLFRGTGRTVPPSGVSITSNMIRVPVCYMLASTALGLHGIWWGVTFTAILRGAVIYGWATYTLLRKRKAV